VPHGFDWQEQKPASSVARVSGVIIPPAQWAYGVPLSILRGWDTRIFTLDTCQFYKMIGDKLKRYWKIGIHWLMTLRSLLAQPFDKRAIEILGST
jgi:hypothetical protein